MLILLFDRVGWCWFLFQNCTKLHSLKAMRLLTAPHHRAQKTPSCYPAKRIKKIIRRKYFFPTKGKEDGTSWLFAAATSAPAAITRPVFAPMSACSICFQLIRITECSYPFLVRKLVRVQNLTFTAYTYTNCRKKGPKIHLHFPAAHRYKHLNKKHGG